MTASVALRDVYPDASLACDLAEGLPRAWKLFAAGPQAVDEVAAARRRERRAGEAVMKSVCAYNRSLGASESSLRNAAALADPGTLCVLSGQQVGFLGGPAYTAYKILTTLRVAQRLQTQLATHVVPMFWLATQDHDFGEICRAHYIADDGEVRVVRFDWDGAGRAISDLPLLDGACRAFDQYMQHAVSPRQQGAIAKQLQYEGGDDYCRWHARIWTRLFSQHGLVLVDPETLADPASAFYREALARGGEIRAALKRGGASVEQAGYPVALDLDRAGHLFMRDRRGLRARVPDCAERTLDPSTATLSPDAALRPLLADTLFPTVANILGPGELSYHALLRPLYDLFGIHQPVPQLRLSCTLVTADQERLRTQLELPPTSLVNGTFDVRQAADRLSPEHLAQPFAEARSRITDVFGTLRPAIMETDPQLDRGAQQALHASLHALDRLRSRALRAELARRGTSPQQMQRLRNAVRPRDRLQERTLPIWHFVDRFGSKLTDRLLVLDRIEEVGHHWLCLEEDDDDG